MLFDNKDWLVVYEDGTIVSFVARTQSGAMAQANQIIANHGQIEEVYKRVR